MRAGERIAAADKSFADFELRAPRRRGGTWTPVARSTVGWRMGMGGSGTT
jgi:hypothetical protein